MRSKFCASAILTFILGAVLCAFADGPSAGIPAGGTVKLPGGTSLPATCTLNETFVKQDDAAGKKVYIGKDNGAGGCAWEQQGSAAAGGYATVQVNGSLLAQRGTINVADSLLTASDDAGNGRTQISTTALAKTRLAEFIVGADNGGALTDADDQKSIFANRLGAGVHIVEVWCQSDAGSPVINLQKNSTTNILSSNLTCTTSGASATTFTSGADALAAGDLVDFIMVTAGGAAKRVTVSLKYTID